MSPPVLLLHGQPGTRADWDAVASRLEGRHRVIAPDRPGYGESGDEAGGFAANAHRMAGLVRELGEGPATVVGHSWGAGVALAMAERHPATVAALVLVAPVVPGTRLGWQDRALADPRYGPALARIGFGLLAALLSVGPLRRLFARMLPGAGGDALARSVAELRRRRTRESFLLEQRALFDELPGLASGVAAVRVPTSVLVGARDRIADPEGGRSLARALPDARLVEFERAGHMLPQMHPGDVAREIEATVARAAHS